MINLTMPQRALCPTTKKNASIMHGPFTLRRVHTTRGSRLILSGYSPACINKATGQEVKITKILSGDKFGHMKKCPPGTTRHLVTKRCVNGSGVSQEYLRRMVTGQSSALKRALAQGKKHYGTKYPPKSRKNSKSRKSSKSRATSIQSTRSLMKSLM